MELSLQETGLVLKEQGVLLVFLIHCFNSLEVDLIREQIQRLVSLPIWINILPGRRDAIFKSNPRYETNLVFVYCNLTPYSTYQIDFLRKKDRQKVQS